MSQGQWFVIDVCDQNFSAYRIEWDSHDTIYITHLPILMLIV